MPCKELAPVWMSALILLAATFARAQNREIKYGVTQTFALRRSVNGAPGTLQLLMDKRLTESVREKLWGRGPWSFVFSPGSVLYRKFSALPPCRSKLRIINSHKEVTAERDLKTTLAKVEAWNPGLKANRLFLVTQDYSAGWGSYNGLATTILQISGGTFHDVRALDVASHQEVSIRLTKSLKSDWRMVHSEGGGEILSVSCHPERNGKFVTDYIRYSLRGTNWFKHERQVKGFWESDVPFPARSAFP